jgi:diaminohydroxyphosphoribosylaminopyrimidine deaminase/5-amino-6-(5-phosphoribosylamino)uracil reductase
MRRALALAARGLGETNPNPVVGCVVARGGRVVGEGYHARAGGPHAEVLALRRAGGRARGATLYVTLEPCAHHGRTPPCAPLVREAGVARVVAALRDPDPRTSGRGLALLRRAGVRVDLGLCAEEAAALNVRFLAAARSGRPYVLLKAALTLDGRIATGAGRSKWITTPAQRRQARALRRLHDAVLVGVGTVLADDPLLLPEPRTRRPFTRVVLDSRLRLPLESRLARTAGPGTPVLVLCGRDAPAPRRRALAAAGVTVVQVPEPGPASLPRPARIGVRAETAGESGLGRGAGPAGRAAAALAALFARGHGSVMVEGGSEVLGSFLAARLVDEVALFRAPLLLGGRASLPAFGGPDPEELGDGLLVERVPETPARAWPWRGPALFELWRPRHR